MMKFQRLLFPALLLSIIWSLCSCGNRTELRQRMAVADSLMANHPDSSYSLLKGIDMSHGVYSKEDKARYALLLSEAQYKNYVEFENDSLINVAVEYYGKKGKGKDYGKSLMYMGAALYDMMDYNGAVEAYKMAQEVLEPLDEYLLLGLINTRIAELYGHIYEDRHTVIEKDKTAAYYYRKANDFERENNANTYIGESYVILSEKDSALFYLGKSIEYSKINKDTAALLRDYYLTSELYIETKDYVNSKDICLQVIRRYGKYDINQIILNLASAYAKLNKVDSAFYYYDKVADGSNLLSEYVARFEIEKCAGNYKTALKYKLLEQSVVDSLQQVRNRQHALLVEKRYDYQKVSLQNQILKSRQETLLIIGLAAVCICVLIIIMLIMFVGRNRRIITGKMAFIEQLKVEADVTKNKFLHELSKKNETEVKLKKILADKLTILQDMASVSYEYGGKANSDILVREYNKIMEVGKLGEGVFKDITDIVNVQCHGIIEHIRREHPELNDDDIHFISLLYCGFSTSAICAFYGYKTQYVVYVRKSRLSKKMKLSIPIDEYIFTTAKDINSMLSI